MVLRFFASRTTLRTFSCTAPRAISSCCSELLKDRVVLKIQRESCTEFLQGLVTNDMNLLSSQKCIYTMLLNSKGRVLFDALIYRTDSPDMLLMECCSDASDAVTRHLRLYSLRKKINIDRSKYSVWAVRKECSSNTNCECVPDPRCNDPWVYRCIAERQPTECSEEGKYSKLRYSLGIAEGSHEIPSGEAFPLEYNADFLNGVSFEKGCYVGQELTARVHHTGVVRKRIMPLELSEEFDNNCDLSEPVKDVETGKAIGKIRGVQKNRALALMRVTETVASKGLDWNQTKVRAIIPSWWPPLAQDAVQKRQ